MAEVLPVSRKEKSVLLHTQEAGHGLGAQSPGMEPRGGLQSVPLGLGLSTTEGTSLAHVPPVFAGGTCQAAEGGAPVLEGWNFLCP